MNIVVRILLLIIVFWPWMLGIGEFMCWFFHLTPIFVWDTDRIGTAVIYPLPAVLVVVGIMWAILS